MKAIIKTFVLIRDYVSVTVLCYVALLMALLFSAVYVFEYLVSGKKDFGIKRSGGGKWFRR